MCECECGESILNTIQSDTNFNKADQVILSGDWNFDFLKEESENQIKIVSSCLFSHGHLLLITHPTRITDNTATLLDMITSSKPHNEITTDIVTFSLSDHLATFMTYPISTNKTSNLYIKHRVYNEAAKNKFCTLMSGTDFSTIYDEPNAEIAFSKFFKLHNENFDIAFPLVQKKFCKKYNPINQWMTSGLLASKKTKDNLFSKKLAKPTHTNIDNYKSFNILYKKLCRKAKQNYFSGKFETAKKDCKLTWQYIKEVLKTTKTKSGLPNYLLVGGLKTQSDTELANTFNNFFAEMDLRWPIKFLPLTLTFPHFWVTLFSIILNSKLSQHLRLMKL